MRSNKIIKSGGSLASDRVMENLRNKPATHDYVASPRVRGKSSTLNLYELTGGRKSQRSHKSKRSQRSHKSKRSQRSYKAKRSQRSYKAKRSQRSYKDKRGTRMMKGGYGSDWMASQYSLGPINNPSGFKDELMNPPNRNKAGSGSSMSKLENKNKMGHQYPF